MRPYDVVWNDTALRSKVRSAAYAAAKDVRLAAQARNPAPSRIKVMGPYKLYGAMEGYAVIGKGNLAHIFEGGRTGGYPIQPGLKSSSTKGTVRRGSGNIALKFTRGDGGFYRGAGFLGGAMAARPYMGPAAALFPTLYRQRAAASLGGAFAGVR